MAPTSHTNLGRRRRSRRARVLPSTVLPKERLPVGTLPTPTHSSITPHITVISRHPSDVGNLDQDIETSMTPVHTNPSYLTETDSGRDLHHRASQPAQTNHQATFADMARVGLGPQREHLRPDHMVSQEPIPLHHYLKFKKPRNRRGVYSPIDEESEPTHDNAPSTFQIEDDIYSQRIMNDSNLGRHQNKNSELPVKANPNDVSLVPATHPVDALGQHFATVRHTFDRELPCASHLQGNEGQRDGEVQFTIDGGGDIHAHAWSTSQFQWVNVGLFSYRRKAIEGALGVRQLKGQKIGSIMPRNQIELFIALAKQFEEENSITAISPTGYDSGSSHARSVQTTLPMISPRPQHPSTTFNPVGDISGPLSSAGYSSQQAAVPMSNMFVGSNNTTTIPPEQRSTLSQMSEDRPLFLELQPTSVSLRESQNSSPTNPHGLSPSSHNHFPMASTANTTFESSNARHGSLSYAPNLVGIPSMEDLTLAEQIKRRQMNIWSEELISSQQSVYAASEIETSQGSYFAERQGASSQDTTAPPQYRTFPQLFGTGDTTMDVFRTCLSQEPSDTVEWSSQGVNLEMIPQDQLAGLSWDNLASRKQNNGVPSQFMLKPNPVYRYSKTDIYRAAGSEPPVLIPELKAPHTSIAMIGSSQVDDGWENRKVRIWSSPKEDRTVSNVQECKEAPPSYEIRGPFFTASEVCNQEEGYEDRQARFERLWGALEATKAERTDLLRNKAKGMLDEGGVPLNEENIEEVATDPLSHMLWAVKINLNSYKATPTGTGDFWQRQFKKPEPKLIDNSATGNNSFFTASSPCSDEILFKGRSSRLAFSSQSQGRSSSPTTKNPVFRLGAHSFGFEEHMKRRAREGSSLASW